MGRMALLYRLILRPLVREPGRALVILFAVALGDAAVVAIDLAGDAAAGSFHSSMETPDCQIARPTAREPAH